MNGPDAYYSSADQTLGSSSSIIRREGCTVSAWTRTINTKNGNNLNTPLTVGGPGSPYVNSDGNLDRQAAYNSLTGSNAVVYQVSNTVGNPSAVAEALKTLQGSESQYYVTGRAKIETGGHEVNIYRVSVSDNGSIDIAVSGTSQYDSGRKYLLADPKAKDEFKIDTIYYVAKGTNDVYIPDAIAYPPSGKGGDVEDSSSSCGK